MIPSIHGFQIEPTNMCTLKCPGCSRTQFIEQWPQHWKNHSLDIDQVLDFLDIDLHGTRINLCGNYGDPIYHPDLIRFVSRLKETGAVVSLVTNGSYKDSYWWEQLVSQFDSNDTVTFSVDGMPDNFTEYRKNAEWTSIEIGLKICVAASCKTIWKYIPFEFNQHCIESAKQLSQQLGIDQFMIQPSDRFDQHTEQYKPKDPTLLNHRYQSMQDWKNQNVVPEVHPRCQSGLEHFITASGFYTPCCYLSDHRFLYKTIFGKNQKKYSIATTTLSKIINQPEVLEFYSKLDQHSGCQYNCPKTQFVV
jgi:organic radical activating enzyme